MTVVYKKTQIDLIGVAACIGAPDRHCELGPKHLQAEMRKRNWLVQETHWSAMLQADSTLSQVPVLQQVARMQRQLASQIGLVLKERHFPVVIGGDHSCAIGTWSGVAEYLVAEGEVGLVWVDAHMDSHVPETSPSGAIHGMPVACLLGYGEPALTDIGTKKPKIKPENICLVGVRSYEQAEKKLLQKLGVKVLTIADVNRIGVENALLEARSIASAGTVAYGISIDLDAINPIDAPGVGSPVVGGIGAKAILNFLHQVRRDPNFIALEIAELNPVNDIGGRTVDLMLDMLSVLAKEEAS